jgi:hypothetical protein
MTPKRRQHWPRRRAARRLAHVFWTLRTGDQIDLATIRSLAELARTKAATTRAYAEKQRWEETAAWLCSLTRQAQRATSHNEVNV